MIKKYSKFKDIILPNKKVNYFVFSLIVIGFITGCLFLIIINKNDKELVIKSITTFANTIKKKDALEIIKNTTLVNYLYIFLIWILSFSLIGIIFNIVLIYLRSFILGFTISALFLSYKLKAILVAFLYTFPSQIINLFVIYLIGIYSIIFTLKLVGQVFKREINIKNYLKKYFYILLISIVLTAISTVLESILFPYLLKLFIKIYV